MYTTPVSIAPASHKISLSHRLCCIGSCFAQTMGQRWIDHKFSALVNPFGTLYNPVSVFRLLQYALNNEGPGADTYLEHDGLYFNDELHSDLHADSLPALQRLVRKQLQRAGEALRSAHWIIVTLGSALVYERQDTGRIVANCHKQPAVLFRQRLLTVEEISQHFEQLKATVAQANPQARYLFTVSPVRHLRDTLTHNAVSKSTLRLAVAQWQQTEPERIHYFPSYEIMLDELRDYRYYAADMLHPNEVAQDYIWQRLTETYLDEEAQAFCRRWDKLRRALAHRPRNPNSEEHRRFLQNTLEQLKQLSDRVDVYTEIQQIETQLL